MEPVMLTIKKETFRHGGMDRRQGESRGKDMQRTSNNEINPLQPRARG